MKEIKEGKIKTAVLDMDGTIYQLDGENNGFKNSTLHKIITANAIRFFSGMENISPEQSKQLISELNKKDVSLSVYASEKYQISRTEYFKETWDIDPVPIVVNYQEAVEAITQLAGQKIELILLTQAPEVWQNNVFDFIGLQNIFSEIYTAESYIEKSEVFPKIKKTRQPQTVIAVGDQIKTDIIPAIEQGFHTFYVTNPKDLLKLV